MNHDAYTDDYVRGILNFRREHRHAGGFPLGCDEFVSLARHGIWRVTRELLRRLGKRRLVNAPACELP